MSLMPHNHQMFSVVGIYVGREDNVVWRRKGTTIEAAAARSLGVRDVVTLGRDCIHSVVNPIGKLTRPIHVYGGDFFDPEEPRSDWDHETLVERPLGHREGESAVQRSRGALQRHKSIELLIVG
jgi:predicted metal-dependent enzyme (double-stranded beta helix superfamily)